MACCSGGREQTENPGDDFDGEEGYSECVKLLLFLIIP